MHSTHNTLVVRNEIDSCALTALAQQYAIATHDICMHTLVLLGLEYVCKVYITYYARSTLASTYSSMNTMHRVCIRIICTLLVVL